MKTTQRKGKAAFTLIELMAVITIIVILAALVVGGLGYVTEKQASSKAKVQISLLSKALEEYKMDTGSYPATANASGSNPAKDNTGLLYQALFYEGYDYSKQATPPATWTKRIGTVDVPKATKIYLTDLDPRTSKQGWVDPVTTTEPPATATIKDPWGTQYRYRSAAAPAGTTNSDTINPDFDLWSSGKDGNTNPNGNSASDKKINADDIKN